MASSLTGARAATSPISLSSKRQILGATVKLWLMRVLVAVVVVLLLAFVLWAFFKLEVRRGGVG